MPILAFVKCDGYDDGSGAYDPDAWISKFKDITEFGEEILDQYCKDTEDYEYWNKEIGQYPFELDSDGKPIKTEEAYIKALNACNGRSTGSDNCGRTYSYRWIEYQEGAMFSPEAIIKLSH